MNTQYIGVSAPTVFQFQENLQLRVILIDGEPWFVAADVCAVLEMQNPTQALKRLDDDEKANFKLGLPGGDTNIINESGLYSLILGSRKPEAKKFKKWVTSEVLPAIRKTGNYSITSNSSPADETLTAQDQNNINRIIWDIVRFQRHESGWTQGAWLAIRKRTDNPSPHKFTVDHLPLLAEELRRILNAAQKLRDHTRKLEQEVLKTVIRGGGDIDAIIAREEADHAATLIEITQGATSALDGWQLRELSNITNRTNEANGDYRGLDEDAKRLGDE